MANVSWLFIVVDQVCKGIQAAIWPETEITILEPVKASEIDLEQAKAMFMGHEVWIYQGGSSYRIEVEGVISNDWPESPMAPDFVTSKNFRFWLKQKSKKQSGELYVPIETDDILAVL